MNSNILISGAGGFLGSEVIKQLLQDENQKYHIIAVSSKKEQLIDKFNHNPRLTVLHTDTWRDEVELNYKIDALVNCAFPRTSDPEQLAKALLFTENLIENAIKLNTKKIINISSQSVYSQKRESMADENTTVIPESFYGLTKYASERIVSGLSKGSSKNICFSNIRLASLSGSGLEVRMTNRFVKKALERETIIINGGKQNISYLDVRDAASAIIAMINTDSSSWSPVYNLGNFDYFTILELAETVREAAKEYSINNVEFEIREGNDNFNNLINSELFYSHFKWKPHYTMPLMVRDLFEYYTKSV